MAITTTKIVFLLVVFLIQNKLFAVELNITNRVLGFDFNLEYNRTFLGCHYYAIFGGIELNDKFTLETGFSLGKTGDEFDIRAFASGSFIPDIVRLPLNLNLLYIFNSLPGYKMRSNTVSPYFSCGFRRWGFAIGPSFRFVDFYGDLIFEPVLPVYSIYYNLLNYERFIARIELTNFINFYAGNLNSLWFVLNGTLRLNRRISLINEFKLYQSGFFDLAATFYGLAFTGGLRLLW